MRSARFNFTYRQRSNWSLPRMVDTNDEFKNEHRLAFYNKPAARLNLYSYDALQSEEKFKLLTQAVMDPHLAVAAFSMAVPAPADMDPHEESKNADENKKYWVNIRKFSSLLTIQLSELISHIEILYLVMPNGAGLFAEFCALLNAASEYCLYKHLCLVLQNDQQHNDLKAEIQTWSPEQLALFDRSMDKFLAEKSLVTIELHLENHKLSDDFARWMAKYLVSPGSRVIALTLPKYHLYSLPDCGPLPKELGSALQETKSLHFFDPSRNTDLLMRGLSNNNLLHLNCDGMEICNANEDLSVQFFAYIKYHHSLQTLHDLSIDISIANRLSLAFIDSFKAHRTLRTLSIHMKENFSSKGTLTSKGTDALVDIVKSNPCLTELELKISTYIELPLNTALLAKHVTQLFQNLVRASQKNSTLMVLHMRFALLRALPLRSNDMGINPYLNPYLCRFEVDYQDVFPDGMYTLDRRLITDYLHDKSQKNQWHNLHWCQVVLLASFMRANSENPLRLSIIPLIRVIMKLFIGFPHFYPKVVEKFFAAEPSPAAATLSRSSSSASSSSSSSSSSRDASASSSNSFSKNAFTAFSGIRLSILSETLFFKRIEAATGPAPTTGVILSPKN